MMIVNLQSAPNIHGRAILGVGAEWDARCALIEKDEINVPIALSAFRDGDQGPSKVTKTELCALSRFQIIFIAR